MTPLLLRLSHPQDILNMPPKGAWRPSLNLSTVLQSLGLLLGHPNPDDGLVTDIVSGLAV